MALNSNVVNYVRVKPYWWKYIDQELLCIIISHNKCELEKEAEHIDIRNKLRKKAY